jgi:hypothetical protein
MSTTGDALDIAEKGVSGEDSSATLTSTYQPHNDHHHHSSGYILHAGQKIRHFLHPSGRKIHIAQHPEQEQSLRRHLSVIHPESEYDIVIHGSDQHVSP